MAHPHLGCCFVVVAYPVEELGDMALQVRVSPCLFNQPAQGVLDRTMRSGPGSPVLGSKTGGKGGSPEIVCTCPRHCLSEEHTWSAGLHLALHRVVAPQPSSIAHSVPVLSVTCAGPSSTCQCQVRPHHHLHGNNYM